MSDTIHAPEPTNLGAGHPDSHSGYRFNVSPPFASVTNSPTSRFESDKNGVYLTLRTEYVRTGSSLRVGGVAESFDILPPSLALSYELAVALGRRATSLVRDESPEIDLGSAL